MPIKFSNNATTTISGGISNSDTTIVVATGTGTLFPTLTASDHFYCTLEAGTVREIVKVTARTSDTFTVVRGQEGTTAVSWADGSDIANRVTATSLNEIGSSAVSFPQNSQSADYTLVLEDAGKMIFHPAADTMGRTWTIPANASVAFPVGTVIMLVVQEGAGGIRLIITSDTLRNMNGWTGSRWLAENVQYYLVKVTTTEWLLAGDIAIERLQIAVAHATTPYISAYPWSATGFGTKFTNPGTLPTGIGFGVAFNEI